MPYDALVHQCRTPSCYYTWWGRAVAPGTIWWCRRCGRRYKLIFFELVGVRQWVRF